MRAGSSLLKVVLTGVVAFTLSACSASSANEHVVTAAFAPVSLKQELAQSKRGAGEVILLRGGFDVFSNGLNTMGARLRSRGVNARVLGYKQWRSVVADVARNWKRSRRPVVIVGHSWGGNTAIRLATALERRGVPIAYLATFAATAPPPVPGNVRRAVNYYQSSGWGAPLRPARNFRGRLRNVNLAREKGVGHYNIEKQPKLQRQVIRNVLQVVRRGRS